MATKVYVTVITLFTPEGRVTPQVILWKDGRKFSIEKIKEVRKAGAYKVGGFGTRYTCMIRGKEKYLFRDHDKWFMEVEE